MGAFYQWTRKECGGYVFASASYRSSATPPHTEEYAAARTWCRNTLPRGHYQFDDFVEAIEVHDQDSALAFKLRWC